MKLGPIHVITVVGLSQHWSSQENPDYPDNSNSDPDFIRNPDN